MSMVEPSAIVELWRSRRDASAILATLVRVEGSAYRRPGARMYIDSAGYAGAISGGCLEGEVVRKATWLTRNGPAVERYSTLFDEVLDSTTSIVTRDIPYGLGCGGVIDVLMEPIELPETNAMLLALEAAQLGEILYSATLLPSFAPNRIPFARVIVRQRDSAHGDAIFFASDHLKPEAQARLAARIQTSSMRTSSMQTGKPDDTVSITIGDEAYDVFLESILPPQRLVIFGAGDDARPLARMAHLLGWHIAVADGRARLAQASRFPEAEQVVALTENAANLEELRLTDRDAVVLLTHSFDQDKNLLRKLLPMELRYLGLLGARHRSRILLTEVGQQLGWTPEHCLSRLHAPVGLDLGGDSPEAVALAILAEIQSVLHQKNAISRRMPDEALHAVPERPYIPAQCPLDNDPQPPHVIPTTH